METRSLRAVAEPRLMSDSRMEMRQVERTAYKGIVVLDDTYIT